MGKGPFVKKVKGNYLLYLNGYHFKLDFILFPSLQNNPVSPLERGWNCSKSTRLYVHPCESLPSAWGLSQKECVAVTAVHQPGWVVLRMLLSSVIGRLQQLWPETELLHFLDIVGIRDPFNLKFYTGRLCYLNRTFPELNPFNLHRYQLQLFWPVFNSFFLQGYCF